jgi:hypothetical protein
MGMLSLGLSPSVCSVPRSGGGGAPPAGPAVFLLAGQSNMVGWATHDGGTIHPTEPDQAANVLQWSRASSISGDAGGNVIAASVSDTRTQLDHVSTLSAGSAGLDIALSEYLVTAFAGRDIILVPCAKGGTGINITGDTLADGWQVGGGLYDAAIYRTNAAIAASGGTFTGIIWHQGERNVTEGTAQATYLADLVAVIAGFRAGITGALASTPLLLGEMNEAYVAASAGSDDDGAGLNGRRIQAALRETPGTIAYSAVASAQGLPDKGDSTHFSGAAYRTLGTRYGMLWTTAVANAATVPDAITDLVATGGDGEIVLTWSAVAGNGTPVTGYVVESSEDEVTWASVDSTDRDTLTLTYLGMTPNVETFYRVAATSGLGNAAWSNAPISATATLTIVAEASSSAHWFLPEQTTDLVSGQTLTITGSQDGATNIITLGLNNTDKILTGRTDTAVITIACVVKLNASSTNFVQVMGTRASNGGVGETGMGLFKQGTSWKGQFEDGATEKDFTAATKSEWTFIAMSIDSLFDLVVHRNGASLTTTRYSATAAGRGTTGAAIKLGAGGFTQPTENAYANGLEVAEIIVWEGAALTGAELQAVGLRSIARAASAGLMITPAA